MKLFKAGMVGAVLACLGIYVFMLVSMILQFGRVT